jgi:hypothetical protein
LHGRWALQKLQRVRQSILQADVSHLYKPRLRALFRVQEDILSMDVERIILQMAYHGE